VAHWPLAPTIHTGLTPIRPTATLPHIPATLLRITDMRPLTDTLLSITDTHPAIIWVVVAAAKEWKRR